MGRHYFCDICRWLGKPVKRTDWKIEDDEYIVHVGTHTMIELVMYAVYVANGLYEGGGKYEADE